MPLIKEQLASGKSVKFSPHGVSMLPMIRQGIDSIILSPLPKKLKKYDIPLYQRDSGQYVLHRIVAVENDSYICMGDNQFTAEYNLRHDQMIAVVTEFYRGKKKYSVTDIRYQLYCRGWYYSRSIRHFWRRGIGWLKRHLRGQPR